MRFAVSDEAAALRDAVGPLLRAEVTGAVLRDPALVEAAWRKVADTGVVGALVPEADGGLGLGLTGVVPVLEELGHSGLPVPAVETIAVAAPLIGDRGVLVAASDSDLVPHASHAGLVVLRAGDRLVLHERDAIVWEPVATVSGSRGTARAVRTGAGTALAGDAEAAWQRGVLGTSAVLVGLAARMVGLTVGYVKERRQFGVPVGSFQAVNHALANAHLAVEFARPMVAQAAWAQEHGAPDAVVRTSAAKALASDAALRAARTAVQCHGAMGYTTEYDLHLYAKRAWALANDWGTATRHRALVASAIGLEQT